MPCPVTSCHFVPCNVSLAVGVCYAPSQRNASQQIPTARKTFKTELQCLVVAPCHIDTEHSRNTSVPDILVCCSFCDRRKRATVKKTTTVTLHIRLLLLPLSETHERAQAHLMTTCHNHRLQSFCERTGASVPHFVVDNIQHCEGAVCLGILGKERKHESQRANDCMPSRCSRTDPRQLLRIRTSVQRCK